MLALKYDFLSNRKQAEAKKELQRETERANKHTHATGIYQQVHTLSPHQQSISCMYEMTEEKRSTKVEDELLALKQLVASKDAQVSSLMKRVNSNEDSMTVHIEGFQKKMEEMEIKVDQSRYCIV